MVARWSVHGRWGRIELELPVRATTPHERAESAHEIRQLLHAARYRDLPASRVLCEVHARLCGGLTPSRRSNHLDLTSARVDAIGDELVAAARHGRLLARAVRPRFVAVSLEEQSVEDCLGPEPEPTAWIAIEVVDDDGEPVPNVTYRIDCDDGRVRTGETNGWGKAREEGLNGGGCSVSFPRLHGPDWKRIA